MSGVRLVEQIPANLGITCLGSLGLGWPLASEYLQNRSRIEQLQSLQTSLSEAIFSLSSVWGVNIVAGKEFEGQVSGSFTSAPLAEVLDAILSANGFGYRRSGQSLVILPQASIGADDPYLVSRTIHLPSNQVDQEAVLSAAKLLLSQKGQLQAVPEHGSVLVIDTADRIQRVERFFAELQPMTHGDCGTAAIGFGCCLCTRPTTSPSEDCSANL